MTEDGSEGKDDPPKPIPMPSRSGGISPTSPATDELNVKIASVKAVWESMPVMPTVFEKRSVSLQVQRKMLW